MIDLEWFDPTVNYYGPEWDEAWKFGETASRLFPDQAWTIVSPKVEEMWLHGTVGPRKSWLEARPAIYAGWRASRLSVLGLKPVEGSGTD